MSVVPVRKIGDPVLRLQAREVRPDEFNSPELAGILQDMVDTMIAEEGIGIAAPQIGESLRMALVDIPEESARYGENDEYPLTAVINPKVTVLDTAEAGMWEGCLSVPELRGLVFRPRRVRVEFQDYHGDPHVLELEDLPAIVFQHEIDHLDGVLFVDRIRDMTKVATVAEYQKHWANEPISE